MKKKFFRLNVVVSYFESTSVKRYRQPILSILLALARLYFLEHAVSINHDFESEDGEDDLIYLRSTDRTQITKQDLRALIDEIFRHGPSLFDGVDVGCQLYKALPQYPFPPLYYKPLNYPYVEFHNGNESSICIYQEALDTIEADDEEKHSPKFLS